MTSLIQFNISPRPSNTLVFGTLTITHNSQVIFTSPATSGLAKYQYNQASSIKGKGLIPQGVWDVSNLPYYSNVPGISGLFFHITPDPHPITGRSQFGIHADSNYKTSPGSSGCIVVLPVHFSKFVRAMKTIPLKSVPLNVNYV